MMKRRNMAVEPESPLTESNKQVSVCCYLSCEIQSGALAKSVHLVLLCT